MDKNSFLIFQSDVKAQIELIKIIGNKLTERANNLTPEDIIRLESVAYQIYDYVILKKSY